MHRKLLVPSELQSFSSSNLAGKLFVAYSDLAGKKNLEWKCIEKQLNAEKWEEFQYDIETSNGQSLYARDMIYGFCYLEMTPIFKGDGLVPALQRITSKVYGEAMNIPPLNSLRKLTRHDFLRDGMWIVLVRAPRPVGSRQTVPLTRRKEITKLMVEIENNPASPLVNVLQELRQKVDNEIHPTEAQLYVTRDGTLIQQVAKHVICNACGAEGHHMAHTHEFVTGQSFSFPGVCLQLNYPDWMRILPMPQETLNLPQTDAEKGFEIRVRQTSAKIPLRLARQLKLNGAAVEGAIAATGLDENK